MRRKLFLTQFTGACVVLLAAGAVLIGKSQFGLSLEVAALFLAVAALSVMAVFSIIVDHVIGRQMAAERNEAAAAATALAHAQSVGFALDSASALVMIADSDLKISYLNRPLQTLLSAAEREIRRDLPKFDAANLVGTSIDVFHKNPSHQRSLVGALTGTHTADVRLGGHLFRLAVNPVRNAHGDRIGAVVEWRDITLEHRITAEIEAVVTAAGVGDFSGRADLGAAEGLLKELGEKVNVLAEVVDHGVSETRRAISAIAEGDLSVEMAGDFHGEFAAMRDDVNATVSRLRELIAQAQRNAADINGSSQEIATGSEDLSSRSEGQAAALEETAATMEEMTATIRSNADNAGRASEMTIEAAARAEKGGEVVADAVTAMSRIEASAGKIADITGVIDAIAFQTNLLALNAAVEAARAGDAGKGFAVVAQEVRTLAQRSGEAAKDIKGLIADSSTHVADGVRLVNDTGAALAALREAIEQATATVTEISAASREQSAGVEEISAALSNMDQMTQQNATMAERSASSARRLSGRSSELTELVSFFRAGADAGAAPRTSEAAQDDAWQSAESAAGAAPRRAGGDDWSEF